MIKAIIFDTGGVLIHEQASEIRDHIAKKYNFSSEMFKKFFFKYLDFSYTGWHHNAFFSQMVKDLGLELDHTRLSEEWLKKREETSKIDKEVQNLINLLNKNYVVGMLSNSTRLNEKVTARKKALKLFDKNLRLLSCEIGFRKPQIEAYQILIERLNELKIKPDETIFIDDKEENLVPARELGIKTIHFKDLLQLKSELKEYGVTWE